MTRRGNFASVPRIMRPTKKRIQKTGSQSPLTAILFVLCLILLGGLIYYFNQYQVKTVTANQLLAGVLQIAEATESEEIMTAFTDPDTEPAEALSVLSAHIEARLAELDSLRTNLAQEREELERLRGERDAVTLQIRDTRSRADRLGNELTETQSELAQLQEQHTETVAELNRRVEELSSELERARSRLERSGIEPDEEEVPDADPEVPAEPATQPGADMTALPDGESELFKGFHYDEDINRLTLFTIRGHELVYRDVPPHIPERMVQAPSFDIFYRMNVLQNFPCEPDDLELIRSLR